MKTLVIGARGFIGSALVSELARLGVSVTCVSRGSLPADVSEGITWFRLDQASQQSWDEIVSEKFDVIFHFGWSTVPTTAEDNPVSDLVENVGAGLRLLMAVRRLSPKARVIFASSGGTVYGRVADQLIRESHPLQPISAYGVGKLAFEQYMTLFRSEHGLDAIIARISNPYGPSQHTHRAFGAVSTFLQMASRKQMIKIFGSGHIVRDYLYISDLCDALIKLASLDHKLAIVNIGSGVGSSLFDIIHTLKELLDRDIDYEIIKGRRFDLGKLILDTSILQRETGWKVNVDLKGGMAKMLSYNK